MILESESLHIDESLAVRSEVRENLENQWYPRDKQAGHVNSDNISTVEEIVSEDISERIDSEHCKEGSYSI